MSDRKSFFSGIAGKLSILTGGAVALVNGVALPALPTTTPNDTDVTTLSASGTSKSLPPKLTLKQQKSGFKMIANHVSHSSHSSHSSHASHASHTSSAM